MSPSKQFIRYLSKWINHPELNKRLLNCLCCLLIQDCLYWKEVGNTSNKIWFNIWTTLYINILKLGSFSWLEQKILTIPSVQPHLETMSWIQNHLLSTSSSGRERLFLFANYLFSLLTSTHTPCCSWETSNPKAAFWGVLWAVPGKWKDLALPAYCTIH